jgi:SpoVK/Ycf46/Vps4 family AAA+-type ATPase
MQDLTKRLRVMLKARYPILVLLTHEEARVLRALDKLSVQEGRPMFQWSCTSGLIRPDGRPVPKTTDPARALVEALKVQAASLFVFLDLTPFLEDARVRRSLRELGQKVGTRSQGVLLVGPKLAVPSELEKMVYIIDVPLPTYDEVSRLLGVLLKSRHLRLPGSLVERFVSGALGLTEDEIKRLFARILLEGDNFSESDLTLQIEEKRQAIRRSRFLEFWGRGEALSHVGGMDNLKGWLEQRSLAFSARARQFGLPEPKGLFLLGVQGCGKSLMAKAVAEMWKMPLLRLDVAAVFQSSGRQEESLRETVRIAESLAPAVLWIDELEKGFVSEGSGAGEAFGYFLTWMQEKTSSVFVVATANEVRALPPELLRKGRFDEIFFVDLPNVHERLEILEIQLRRRGRDPVDYDLITVAEETERFSGAELEQVIIAGMYTAFAAGRQLSLEDIVDAGRELIPLAVTMDDRLKDLREWARPRARPASTDRRRIDFFDDWDEIS